MMKKSSEKKSSEKKADSAPAPQENVVARFRREIHACASHPADMYSRLMAVCDELDPANARKVHKAA